MDNRTRTGLLLLMIGTIISIITNAALFLSSSIVTMVSSIGVIGALMVFIGIILMILGRKEFGEKHSKYVLISLLLFILAIAISIVVVTIAVLIALSTEDIGSISSIFYIVPIASISSALAYVFLLHELEDQTGKMILYIATIVSIVVAFYISMNIIPIFEETIGTFEPSMSIQEMTELQNAFTERISTISAPGFLTNILMFIAIYLAYKRVESGEIRSVD